MNKKIKQVVFQVLEYTPGICAFPLLSPALKQYIPLVDVTKGPEIQKLSHLEAFTFKKWHHTEYKLRRHLII